MQDGNGSGGGRPPGGAGGPAAGAETPVPQVRDRRRFGPDGEERPELAGAAAEAPPPSLDETVGAQAARIDELTRACAALVDDNRAFRQRIEREKDRVVAAERAKVAQALLETHDELELAFRASLRGHAPENPALKDLREGVRLTLQGLAGRVAALGAERIEVRGKPYDPQTAEAVDLVAVGDPAQDGIVVEEIRPGWRIGDRVLRPARVRVGRIARA